MRAARLIAAAWALALAGCFDAEDPVAATDPVAHASTDEEQVRPEPHDYQIASIVDLGEGSHSVFGLRIPGGMRPAAGPHRVYRFEGTWDLVAVRRFVMRQVETGMLEDEPSGYLIRQARVLEPVGEADSSLRLAIRIFRGRKGGATIDVWAELDRERERARATGIAGGRTDVAGGKAAVIEPGSPEASQRARQRRETFDMMEKISRGEALSPEDAANPFFH